MSKHSAATISRSVDVKVYSPIVPDQGELSGKPKFEVWKSKCAEKTLAQKLKFFVFDDFWGGD